MAQVSYQQAMLDELEKVAADLGSPTVIAKNWANTGTLIAGTPFTQYATVYFDFQSDYATFQFNGASAGAAGMSFYVKITDTAKANEMLGRWRELVAEGMQSA